MTSPQPNDILDSIRDAAQVRLPDLQFSRYDYLVFAADPKQDSELGGVWPHSYVGFDDAGEREGQLLLYVVDGDDKQILETYDFEAESVSKVVESLVEALTFEISNPPAEYATIPLRR